MLAHHMRHQQAVREIHDAIAQGRIGAMVTAWMQWGYRLDPRDKTATWKLDPTRSGGGTFHDNGVHLIDLVMYLFGMPDSVSAYPTSPRAVGSPRSATAVLTYGDAIVVLSSSWNTSAPGNHILVYGTHGNIEAFGGVGQGPIRTVGIVDRNGPKRLTYDVHDPLELYRAEFEDFFGAYISGENSERGTTIDDAVNAMKLLDCIQASARRGQPLQLP